MLFRSTGAAVTVGALATANAAGRLVKAGAGTLTFTGVSNFLTPLTINDGTVAVGAGGALNASTLAAYKAGRFLVVAQGGGIVGDTLASVADIARFVNGSSAGAIALSPATAATNLDFGKAGYNLPGMGLGAGMGDVTYTGVYTPGNAGVFRFGGGGGNLTYQGNITGANSTVAIIGSSASLTGTNTFSGGFTLATTGVLQVLSTNAAANFGQNPGGLTALGGTIRWATGATTDITSGAGAISGGISLIGTTIFDTNGNDVELAGSIGNYALTNASFTGIGGGLTKAGAGKLTLSGANAFLGNSTVTGGTLVLKNSNALAFSSLQLTPFFNATSVLPLVFDSSVASKVFTVGGLNGNIHIALQDNAATPNAITLRVGNGAQSSTYGAVLSGPGSLTKLGSGTFTLNALQQTYGGSTTIQTGSDGITTGQADRVSTLALAFGTTAVPTIPNTSFTSAPNATNILPSTTALNFGGGFGLLSGGVTVNASTTVTVASTAGLQQIGRAHV